MKLVILATFLASLAMNVAHAFELRCVPSADKSRWVITEVQGGITLSGFARRDTCLQAIATENQGVACILHETGVWTLGDFTTTESKLVQPAFTTIDFCRPSARSFSSADSYYCAPSGRDIAQIFDRTTGETVTNTIYYRQERVIDGRRFVTGASEMCRRDLRGSIR